jgi:predicted ATP-dependent serine protease
MLNAVNSRTQFFLKEKEEEPENTQLCDECHGVRTLL